jgi:hypothetical protein
LPGERSELNRYPNGQTARLSSAGGMKPGFECVWTHRKPGFMASASSLRPGGSYLDEAQLVGVNALGVDAEVRRVQDRPVDHVGVAA